MLWRLRRLWLRLRDEYTIVEDDWEHLRWYRIRNRFTGYVRFAGPLPPEHVNCRCSLIPVTDCAEGAD